MQQQQKQEKKQCEVEQLLIPVLHKLEPESFEIKKQLIIYINNSQMRQEQFEQVLKNNKLNFENIAQGLFIEKFTENASMLYFQNLVDTKESIGWLIRAREFLYKIGSKKIIEEIHFVFHSSEIFKKKEEEMDKFIKIFRIIINMLTDSDNNQIMSFIQGDYIDQQFQMKMNIQFTQLFEKNINEVVNSMKIYDSLRLIQTSTSFNKINQLPNQVDQLLFQYIQPQLMIIVGELFDEIEIVLNYLMKLLEFDQSEEQNLNYKNFRQLLLQILNDFPNNFNFTDFMNDKSKENTYFYKFVRDQFRKIWAQLTIIIGKNQGKISQEFQFLSTYQFKFQLTTYKKILQYYEFYLPQDKISIKYRQYFQTVKQWIKNYDMLIELKLYKISQIINLNFLKRDNSLKSIFVLGLSKVGKSTLLNIIKNHKNLRIANDNENFQCMFEAIEEDQQLKISSVCISETESLQYFKIHQKLYVDTPGFDDTNQNVRLRNTFNIYQGINNFQQVAFILVFDAKEIIQNKSNFLKTIDKFIELVGEDFLKLNLENFILPIFTKAYLQTIDKIKQDWHIIIQDTNLQQQRILNLISSKLNFNNYVVIYDALHLDKNKGDLYSYLDDVQIDINAKCDILFKQQYAFFIEKPKLKLTLQPELQHHFNNLIPQARQIFECIVQYVQEEIQTQLLETPQDEETIDQFFKDSQNIFSKQPTSFIDSSEILKQFFITAQNILQFEYNKYNQKLASQYFKFIEVSKITHQEQQFQKEQIQDFFKLKKFLMDFQKASQQAKKQIVTETKKQIILANCTKLGKNVQQSVSYCQPLTYLLCFVAAEVCIAAVAASFAVDLSLQFLNQKLQAEQEAIQKQGNRLKFQYFLKKYFQEITKS